MKDEHHLLGRDYGLVIGILRRTIVVEPNGDLCGVATATEQILEALRPTPLLEAGDEMRGVEPAAWLYEKEGRWDILHQRANPRMKQGWTETPLYTAAQLALAKAAAPAPASDDEMREAVAQSIAVRRAKRELNYVGPVKAHSEDYDIADAILPLIALAKSRAAEAAREACARIADDLALNYEAWRQNADPLENGRDALAFKHKREAAREVASQIRALSLPAAPEAPPVIDLVETHAAMLEEVARSTPIRSMRMGLTIAARAIRRGRTLTADEKLANFKAAMAEWPEDPDPAAPEEQGNEAAFIASIDPAIRIQRLKDAIEGECEGLAIDDDQAANILSYVDTGSFLDEAPPASEGPLDDSEAIDAIEAILRRLPDNPPISGERQEGYAARMATVQSRASEADAVASNVDPLPCDVRVGCTVIRAGCSLSTLMTALRARARGAGGGKP